MTITKVREDGISIMHDAGAARIGYEELPLDLAKQLGGFDPDAALAARKANEEKDAAARARIEAEIKANRDAAPAAENPGKEAEVIYFWVKQNRVEGLLVGRMVEKSTPIIASSTSRAGGGGTVYGGNIYWAKGYDDDFWIPHTDATRKMAIDSEFKAQVSELPETFRLDEETVLKSYRVIKIEPPKK